MQISAIGFNNYQKYNSGFGAGKYYEYDYDGVDMPEDARSLKKAAQVRDSKGGTNKVTSPGKFFLSSVAVALAGFLVAKSACGGAIGKLDNKFGILDGVSKRASKVLVDYVEKHPRQEGKGVGIYFSNKMHELANGIVEYGKKGLSKEILESGDKALIASKATGQAIKQGTSIVLGAGVAGATIQSRYEDKDKNGVPDKAEGAMSAIAEVLPAVVNAIV